MLMQRTCPSCTIRVIPKADGDCPSCGASIADPRPNPSTPATEASDDPDALPARSHSPPLLATGPSQAAVETTPDNNIRPVNPGLEPIVIMPNRVMAGVMLAVGIIFMLTGVLAIVLSGDLSQKFMILGVIALLLGPIISIYSLTKLFSKEPVVVVNDEGIIDNASPASVGLIKWSEITDLSTYSQDGVCFLGIGLKNPDVVLSRRRGVSGTLARFEAGAPGRPPIGIPQTFLSTTAAELLEQIGQRYDGAIRQS